MGILKKMYSMSKVWKMRFIIVGRKTVSKGKGILKFYKPDLSIADALSFITQSLALLTAGTINYSNFNESCFIYIDPLYFSIRLLYKKKRNTIKRGRMVLVR